MSFKHARIGTGTGTAQHPEKNAQLRIVGINPTTDEIPQIVVFQRQQTSQGSLAPVIKIIALQRPEALQDDVQLKQGATAVPLEAAKSIASCVIHISVPVRRHA